MSESAVLDVVCSWPPSWSEPWWGLGLLDLNVGLLVGWGSVREILLYVVVALFFALLLTPATRFLKHRGMSARSRHHVSFPDRPHRPGRIGLISSLRRWSRPPCTFGHEISGHLVKKTPGRDGAIYTPPFLGSISQQVTLRRIIADHQSRRPTNLKIGHLHLTGRPPCPPSSRSATIAVLTLFAHV